MIRFTDVTLILCVLLGGLYGNSCFGNSVKVNAVMSAREAMAEAKDGWILYCRKINLDEDRPNLYYATGVYYQTQFNSAIVCAKRPIGNMDTDERYSGFEDELKKRFLIAVGPIGSDVKTQWMSLDWTTSHYVTLEAAYIEGFLHGSTKELSISNNHLKIDVNVGRAYDSGWKSGAKLISQPK